MSAITRTLLLVYIFFLPLFPEEFGFSSKSLPDISFIRAILLLLTLSLVAGLLMESKFKKTITDGLKEFKTPIVILAIFFIWRILASLLSPSGTSTVISAIRDTLYYIVPFLAGLICFRGVRDVKVVALVVAISATASASIGILEYYTGFSLYGELTDTASPWNTLNLGEFKGALGTFPHPLAYGSYLAAAILLSAILLKGKNGVAVKFVSISSIVTSIVGIIASTSRGALASLFAAFAWMATFYVYNIYLRVKRRQRIFALATIIIPTFMVVLAAATIVAISLVKGASSEQATSSMMRVLQIQLAIPIMGERPLLGYGVGKAAETLGMKAETVDIYYLTVALESGLVGMLIFITALIYFIVSSVKSYLNYRHPYFMLLSMFFVAEFTQLLVLSLKQSIPMLYVGFALYLMLQRHFRNQDTHFGARYA